MAMPLVPSYDTRRVYATWVKQGGAEMRPGTYKVTVPVRVTNATDDVIIPQGVYDTGPLNTTPGVPSLDILVPCTDDPDNLPRGWQLHIEVTFNDAPGEKYVIDVPTDGPDINLRTIVLSETLPVPKDVLIVGVAGGITPLDADAKVPVEFLPPADVDQEAVETIVADYVTANAETLRGPQGEQGPKGDKGDPGDQGPPGTTTVDGLTDATTVGKAVAKAASAEDARDAIGAAGTATATTAAPGLVELATTAETTTGTDAARAVTPAGLAAALAPKATLTADTGIITSGRILVATTPTPDGMQAGDLVVVVPEP